MNSAESASEFLAWWGAGLSTFLAFLKCWELWVNRFKIDISHNFRDEENGNDIILRNLSGKPVILEYWVVYYATGRWPLRKLEMVEMADPDDGDIRIEAHNTCKLHFSGPNYFPWGHKALRGRRIFIRLHIAGRRSLLRLVYPL